ncbi:MAG TPA: MarR family transcriptional regulator [Gemmatimonadaceae bacterium]|jgi:DNA-binding MarR family transcriptional regulator|nr:MarR family transcriptional regulator [Gemmatimonadaceae bacterium]
MPTRQPKPAPESAPDRSTRRVMDALRRIVRGLSASARELPGGSSVSGAQRFVLRQIAAAPGLSVGELAARTLTGQSTVSEVVTRLVERRLVSRRHSATDARQAELTLTAAGRRVIADLEPTAQERLASALARLRPAERQGLAAGLEAWLAAAGLDELPITMFLEERSARSRAGTPAERAGRSRTSR